MKKRFFIIALGIALFGCSQKQPETGYLPVDHAIPPANSGQKPTSDKELPTEKAPSQVAVQPATPQTAEQAEIPSQVAAQPATPQTAEQAEIPSIPEDNGNSHADVLPLPDDTQVKLENAPVQAQAKLQGIAPLPPEHVELLNSITWDLPPEILDAVKEQHEGKHFLFSDEKHPELFHDSIQNLGGTYIGVGTDQGYLFTGWQRPELAFLIDYDPWVVILHHIYMTFWRACPDSVCLLEYFENRQKANDLLISPEARAKFASYGLKDRKLISKVYRTANQSVARELRKIQKMDQKTFMNDPETFQYIKTLIETERLRSFQANLLGDLAFQSIAQTLKKMNLAVTTLYLSNAEQYWGYTPQFKRNILNLPVHEKAFIMRTSATYPHNQDYRYSIQPMHVFRAWLEHPKGRSVKALTQRVPVEHPEHFPFVIDNKMPTP